MIQNRACVDCKAHPAFRVRIEHIEADNAKQWLEINDMKKLLTYTLISSVFSLLGIIGILVVQLIAYGLK